MKPELIRNFSIIAHIDHGKSTLADRILELTRAVKERDMMDQVLDDMDLERERGITIKARAVALSYRAQDGQTYRLNLIDTPGHVDFSYEVSRSLAACEGALLVVDASQGVEAQTLANVYLALDNDLEILPVLNKVDLPNADPERIRGQIEEIVGLPADDTLEVSAKQGIGVPELLEALVRTIPPPEGDAAEPLKALIFDSYYDSYRGVVILVRLLEGTLRRGTTIRLMKTGGVYEIDQVGVFVPKPSVAEELTAGEVGFFTAGIKDINDAQIGDTVTEHRRPTDVAFPGFREVKPMVFAGLFTSNASDYSSLRDALDKLRLNDSSFTFEPENSPALGFGFRCGFLGLLHMDIVQSRLEREFDLDLITTAPNVRYRVLCKDGEMVMVSNPSRMPSVGDIDTIEEPYIQALIITPPEYLGGILKLVESRRGIQRELKYASPQRVLLEYDLPLNEIVLDFYDRLKSVSRGYASLDYHVAGWWESDLVRLDILVNKEPVDALSSIVHRTKAASRGRALIARMKETIPRQMFEVVLQAAIGTKIIARESVPALRKNVLAKCYGGDITRKRKLLERQKEGKKRMKTVGRIDIPQDAFLAVLKVDE